MFRAVANVARYRARATIGLGAALPRHVNTGNAGHHQCWRHFSISPTLHARPVLSTLNPASPTSPQQKVLDFSDKQEVVLTCDGEPVSLRYGTDKSFPPDTRGMLYYHTRRTHIRFRLCDSLANFKAGSDLLKENGHPWTLSLNHMTARPFEFRQILAMVKDDFPSAAPAIDQFLSTKHVVESLSREEFSVKGQQVINLPNTRMVRLRLSGGYECLIPYFASLRFPANTKGVFYYKQSTTAPTTIGELRFRLCSDLASFDEGTDLALPSGLPWCISSDRIIAFPTFTGLRHLLVSEGLLKEPFPIFQEGWSTPVICSLNQPFVVDLAENHTFVSFKLGTDITPRKALILFSSRGNHFYTGRAVVQFEECPPGLIDSGTLRRKPLLVLRYLEFLTPVEAVPGAQTPYILAPEIGGILRRKNDQMRTYRACHYSPKDPDLYAKLRDLPGNPNSTVRGDKSDDRYEGKEDDG